MAKAYSVYEAKARFSEIIRKVRAGQRVLVSYRGKDIAEIRPLRQPTGGFGERLEQLEEQGVVSRGAARKNRLRPLAKLPGALGRFLESRE